MVARRGKCPKNHFFCIFGLLSYKYNLHQVVLELVLVDQAKFPILHWKKSGNRLRETVGNYEESIWQFLEALLFFLGPLQAFKHAETFLSAWACLDCQYMGNALRWIGNVTAWHWFGAELCGKWSDCNSLWPLIVPHISPGFTTGWPFGYRKPENAQGGGVGIAR